MQKFSTKYEQPLLKSAVNRSYTKTKWASSLKCKDDSTYANKNSTHNDRIKCNDQMTVFTDTEFTCIMKEWQIQRGRENAWKNNGLTIEHQNTWS